MKLSTILPVYNQAQIVGQVLQDIRRLYPDPRETEVLAVDDGSTDGTGDVAAEADARVIRHAYNRGNGAAIKTAIRNAKGGILVMMDGDGQHAPHPQPIRCEGQQAEQLRIIMLSLGLISEQIAQLRRERTEME